MAALMDTARRFRSLVDSPLRPLMTAKIALGERCGGKGWIGAMVMRMLRMLSVFLLSTLFCVGAVALESAVQSVTIHRAELNSLGQQPSDEFGDAVAIDGDTVVVGAEAAQVNGNPTGAAYVFVKPTSGWTGMTQTATLTPSDQAGLFGASVAVSGNTVVVGAPWTTINGDQQEGAVYVYVKPATGWTDMTETAKLRSFHIDAIGEDHVGSSVSIDGNTIVVGIDNVIADGQSLGNGEVFIYVKPADGWTSTTETAVLYIQGGPVGFASSVAISGGTVVVGADGCCSQGQSVVGAAFVFLEPTTGWLTTSNFNAVLSGTNVGPDDNFGYSVAVDGNTIIVGSPQQDSYGVGAAYVYVEPVNGWHEMTQTAELYPLFTSQGWFGESVAISGNVSFIGAPFTLVGGVEGRGAAYGFVKPNNGWQTTSAYAAKLTSNSGYYLGQSVSISGATAVTGFSGTSDTNGGATVFWVSE
jgi:hypothetical protein